MDEVQMETPVCRPTKRIDMAARSWLLKHNEGPGTSGETSVPSTDMQVLRRVFIRSRFSFNSDVMLSGSIKGSSAVIDTKLGHFAKACLTARRSRDRDGSCRESST